MTKTNENVPTVLKHTPLQLLSQQFCDLGLRNSSSLLSLPLPLLSLPSTPPAPHPAPPTLLAAAQELLRGAGVGGRQIGMLAVVSIYSWLLATNLDCAVSS